MDPSSAPFKSPRPPAPRKARAGGSLSRQSSRQSLKDAFGAAPAHETVPPVPDAPLSGLGLAMNDVNAMDIRHNNSNANDSLQEILNGPSNEILAAQQQHSSNNNNTTTTAAAVLSRLEGLLVAKSNEIQLAGRLGEALLSQQAELESRIRELEDEVKKNEDHDHVFGNGGKQKTRQYNKNTVNGIHNDDDDDDSDIESAALVDERVKEKLKELENEMMRWEKGNEQIYKEVGVPSGTGSELVRQASSSSMVSCLHFSTSSDRGYLMKCPSSHSDLNSQIPRHCPNLHLRMLSKTQPSSMPMVHPSHPLNPADNVTHSTERTISNSLLKSDNPCLLKYAAYNLYLLKEMHS